MATARAIQLVQQGMATMEEACKFLTIGRTSLYELLNTKAIPYARFGNERKIPWVALHEYAASKLDKINTL